MSVVIVDGREWQNMFDLRSGDKVDVDTPEIRTVRRILERHPYPGDMEQLSNRWVTDTALELVRACEPSLVCLSFARQYFTQRFSARREAERRETLEDVFTEAERFIAASGYVPVFVGTGDLTEMRGEMDLSRLDAFVSSGGGHSRYTGLHDPSERDLEYIASLPGVERLVSRDEWTALFPGAACGPRRLPDHLLVCREGWTARSAGASPRPPVRMQGTNFTIPVSTTLGTVASITDVRKLIDAKLADVPIALIVVEGVGEKTFPLPFMSCANGADWYCYEPGECWYLTLGTGAHQVFSYPPGFRLSREVTSQREYPFSGFFGEVPPHTLGADFPGRSVAVGNRSMFTHMVFGAGISIECFARNLFNQGCMAVVRDGATDDSSCTIRPTSGPETERRQSMKVAFASSTGEVIDQRFSACETFHVWEIEASDARFVEAVTVPSPEKGKADTENASRADALRGCTMVFSVQIGGPASAKLVARKIHPMRTKTEVGIDEMVDRLQQVLRDGPPPWLRKVA